MPRSEVPDGWKSTTLGDVATIKRGASPRPIKDPKWFANNGPGWVRIADVTASDKYLRRTSQYLSSDGVACSVQVHPGDLIMSICGTIGRPIILDMDACIHDGFVLFQRPFDGVDRDFFYTFLQHKAEEFSGKGQPGTQKNLNTGIVKAAKLLLPPLPEQKKIAAILSSVDEAIQATQAVIEQTRRVKEGLLQDLLTRGMPGHTRFKQTEIGEIPESWEVRKLPEICTRIGVGIASSATHAYRPEGIPLVRNQNIKRGYLDLSDLLHVTPEYDEENRTKRIRQGDVLTIRTGYPGISAVVPAELDNTQSFTTLVSRPTPELVDSYFLAAWINSDGGKRFVLGAKAGGAQQNLNAGTLKSLPVPLPPLDEQKAIMQRFDALTEGERKSESELAALGTVKSGLLQDLLTGNVRVTP